MRWLVQLFTCLTALLLLSGAVVYLVHPGQAKALFKKAGAAALVALLAPRVLPAFLTRRNELTAFVAGMLTSGAAYLLLTHRKGDVRPPKRAGGGAERTPVLPADKGREEPNDEEEDEA